MQNGLTASGISQARMGLFATLFLGLILLAVFALPSISRATRDTGTAKATKGRPKRPEFVPGEILVRYRSEKAAQRQPRAAMVQSAGGRAIEIQVDDFMGSNIVEGLRMARVAPPDTLQAIAALKSQPEVLYAELNYILHKEAVPNDPQFPEMYGLKNTGQSGGTAGADIDAEQAWNITIGSRGIVVGVIDQGIDINHPDLRDNIWINPGEIPGNGIDDDGNGFTDDVNAFDFFHNDNTVFDGASDPSNQTDAHGTHVAGTIGAVGNNGTGVVGVNWQVSLMSLKFLGPDIGSNSDAIRAISYARNMRDTWVSTGGAQGANVRVLSNSYGGGGFSQAFLDAIKAAGNSGILFVAAAGNDSTDTDLLPHYPSSYDAPNMVAVAATDRFDNLSSFSSFGANTVHIAAPGSAILSTTPNNTYSSFSGTSMATPHVSGGAALICAANPNLTLQQLRALLIFNGDVDSFLSGKTLTERRLNVANSLQALNDGTPPGTVASFRVTAQNGRSLSLAWTASGDDGENGQASLYQVSFTDMETGATIPLKNVLPPASASPQTLDIKIPYRHTDGTITLREFDNAGNEGIPGSLPVSISVLDGDPYTTMLGIPAALSTGGTPLGLTFDDRYRENYALPFSFPFFGQDHVAVTVSTNGNLYFSPPPKRFNGDADDVPSSTTGLAKFKMIAGLWDDLDLSSSSRADADVYVVQPDANRIIFRWQGVPCNFQGSGCEGGTPVNFEIELQSNGNIQTRYGSGNTNLFPVVGISGGEPDAYVIPTHTSEALAVNLTNAQTVAFASRAANQPTVSSLSPSSAIAAGPGFTLTVNGTNFDSSSTIQFNGTARSTAFVSATELTATIVAADLALAGSYPITVFNPGPGGGLSEPVNLAVNPSVTSISPATVRAGDLGFTLAVNGAGFVPGTVIRFNGENRSTTFISSIKLSGFVPAADIATIGTYPITVVTPAPASLASNAVNIAVTPTITNLTPLTVVAGVPGFTLTIDGCCFVAGTVVRWNGSDRPTTVVSSSRLMAQITAADIAVGGVFTITVFVPGPGGGTSLTNNFVVSNRVPTISFISPGWFVPPPFCGSAITLTVNGTNFVSTSFIELNGIALTTNLLSSTQLTAQITEADIQTGGPHFLITVENPAPGGGISNSATLIMNEPWSTIASLEPASATVGSGPFTLVVNGHNFSCTAHVLFNGSNRPTTYVSETKLTAQLTAADVQAAGTFPIRVQKPSPGGAVSNAVDFTVIPLSYEADVSPRPNGNNTGVIGISDWTQAGRFAAGLDTPDLGSEFQRADCAPRDTLGSGGITISDWTQAGRYAAGLDPVLAAGGPTGPTSAPQVQSEAMTIQGGRGDESDLANATRVNMASTIMPAGQNSTVSIEFDARGNENAFGFSLMFDPAKLGFISAEKSGEARDATLNVNKLKAAKGRIGIALALPAGSSFASGKHQLLVLTFALRSDSRELPAVGFTDLPIAREVVDLNANRLNGIFQIGSDREPLGDAQFFVYQHYLDFLGRTPDGDGLDYWTQQINQCGTDKLCINQRRIAVSAAFFVEQEFQQTGSVVYRLYKAGLGRQLSYAEFAAYRGQVIGGSNLNGSKSAFADVFVERAEFVRKYQQYQTAAAFVDHLLQQLRESSQVDLGLRRGELIALYQTGGNTNQSRSRVLHTVIEDASFKQAEYNPSFVLMEYFGYLRRDPDKEGYDFWLNVLNNREPGNYRGMICAFITSTEYQRRFSQVVSHSNADCSGRCY